MYGTCVTTTIVSDRKGFAVPETRTYQNVSIRWARGSEWTGYGTVAEAQTVVDFAAKRGQVGEVEVTTFEVEIDPRFAHLYQPGI